MTGCHPERVLALNDVPVESGPVLLWLGRDIRIDDNPALAHALAMASERGEPLAVCFTLVDGYQNATLRAYDAVLRGLEALERDLAALRVPLLVLHHPDPPIAVAAMAREAGVGLVVTDFSPLRMQQQWRRVLAEQGGIAVHTVDAHNIVPCWVASDKHDFAARTFRPKVLRRLESFLTPLPPPKALDAPPWPEPIPSVDWRALARDLVCDRDVTPVPDFRPGTAAGRAASEHFAGDGLHRYDARRNDPLADGQSGLSPWLHYGHVSARRVAFDVRASDAPTQDKDAFLEQLIVRKELSDNFCYYNPDYDRFAGFHRWARTTLDEHRADPRSPCYDRAVLDAGTTHDPLWNAAQWKMRSSGLMHGYLRMYWAKKILQWTASPEEALAIGIALNDRYSLDGRDPNGYVGVAWSVGGVHDRAWQERPIFGKVRYMSYAGCRRKFDVDAYVARWTPSDDSGAVPGDHAPGPVEVSNADAGAT